MPPPTFRLIRYRNNPAQISILLTIPDKRTPHGHLIEAPLFGLNSGWIERNCDIIPDPEHSGETYEAIIVTIKPATTPEKEERK